MDEKEKIGSETSVNGKADDVLRFKAENKRRSYIGSIVSNIVVFFIINLFPLWLPKTHGVVTNAWINALWAMDLNIIINVCGSIVLIAYSPRWFKALIEFLITGTALISVSIFLVVFPLDFSIIVGPWLNTLVRVFLIVGIVGASIGTFVWLVRFLKAVSEFDDEKGHY